MKLYVLQSLSPNPHYCQEPRRAFAHKTSARKAFKARAEQYPAAVHMLALAVPKPLNKDTVITIIEEGDWFQHFEIIEKYEPVITDPGQTRPA